MIILAILNVIFASQSLYAVVTCAPAHALQDAARAVPNLVLAGTQVDDADRRLAEDYARENKLDVSVVKRRYAATGDLECNGGKSQANLTLVDNVITTSAHSVFDNKGCGRPNQKLSGCKFLVEVEGEKQEYPIESTIATGFTCGTTFDRHVSDWAVLRLGKKVDPRVKPYRISPSFMDNIIKGTEVTMVGKSYDWPKDKVANLFDKPKHYGNCASLGTRNVDFDVIITSNCDSSEGLSGGSMLTRGDDPALLGVHVGTARESKNCSSNSRRTSGPGSNCWFTFATAVTGDFREALQDIEKREVPPAKAIPDQENRRRGGAHEL